VFAWTGAALFVGALTYFMFSYSLRFAIVTPGPPDGAAIVWNVALFSLFALHHSVFARERVRAAVARLIPPALERSFYVWVASLLLIAVCAAWQPVGGAAWELSGPARWGLAALQLAGIWLTIHSAATIDVFDLAGVRTERPAATEFKTTGPYGWVRHPIYTGWFLIVFCVGTMTTTRLVFAVISSVYVLIAISFEERSLRATTGGAYNRYAGQVAWKLFPRLY
jgi:protein-S-isoprenylcysteine O-methyltransferase Ste14